MWIAVDGILRRRDLSLGKWQIRKVFGSLCKFPFTRFPVAYGADYDIIRREHLSECDKHR